MQAYSNGESRYGMYTNCRQRYLQAAEHARPTAEHGFVICTSRSPLTAYNGLQRQRPYRFAICTRLHAQVHPPCSCCQNVVINMFGVLQVVISFDWERQMLNMLLTVNMDSAMYNTPSSCYIWSRVARYV